MGQRDVLTVALVAIIRRVMASFVCFYSRAFNTRSWLVWRLQQGRCAAAPRVASQDRLVRMTGVLGRRGPQAQRAPVGCDRTLPLQV